MAAVSTGFPAGQTPFELKLAEIRASVAAGAQEIDIVISRDGRAALIETEQGAGLLWRFGADTVARLLTAPRVSPASSGLRVRFADPGTPCVTLRLDERERPLWAQRLEQVT